MEKIDKIKLRDAMLAKTFGVTELAQAANVSPVIITKFLKADSNCRLPTISKLSKALQIEPQELLLID